MSYRKPVLSSIAATAVVTMALIASPDKRDSSDQSVHKGFNQSSGAARMDCPAPKGATIQVAGKTYEVTCGTPPVNAPQ